MPLLLRQEIDVVQRSRGVLRHRLENANDPRQDLLRALLVEHIPLIVEPKVQARAGAGHQCQCVVGGVVPFHVRQPHAGDVLAHGGAVQRIVLEHRRGVEEFSLPVVERLLDLGEPQVLVGEQPELLPLHV